MTLTPLLPLMYEPLVRTALLEDLGRAGDITVDAIVPADKQSSLVLRARQPGVVAGIDIARCAFQLVNPAIRLTAEGRASGKSLRKCPPRLSSRRYAPTAIISPTSAGSAAAPRPLAMG